MKEKKEIELYPKQLEFVKATGITEVLYGGAAGGGKSYGQLCDALIYALKYTKSRQLILRRTLPELEKSLIRVSRELYPASIGKYNENKHMWSFINGSFIDFGYCDKESDVYRYQSAEYDVIRLDELTHFTEQMYLYLMSRLRGTTNYPRSMKSSTNPGGIGHFWVKSRFIDIGEPLKKHRVGESERLFIPATVFENRALMKNDPEYKNRLLNLSEKDMRQLLYGDWDTVDGQYFTEWDRKIHVVSPFEIPKHWRRYFSLDYGLDMTAGLWIAVDEAGNAYVYREFYKSGLIVSEAAKGIKEFNGEDKIFDWIAPPDLWNRRNDTGRKAVEYFWENGIPLRKGKNDRVVGWWAVKEYLHPQPNEFGEMKPKLYIFSNCLNIIRTLPELQMDQKNPNDVADEPHELTHAPDALRGFCVEYALKSEPARDIEEDEEELSFDNQFDSFINYGKDY